MILEHGRGHAELGSAAVSETVSTLLRYSFNHYLRPEAAYRLACQVAETPEVWRLQLEHPVEAAELIGDRLTSRLDAWKPG